MRLWYWIRTALKNGFIMIMASLLSVGMMGMMDAELAGHLLNMASIYLLFFGAIFGMLLSMTVYKQNLPVALSFVSTRKEAFAGLQCYNLVYLLWILSNSAVLFLLAGTAESDITRIILPVGFAVLLITGMLGSVAGMASIRFGKAATIAISVAAGILVSGMIAFAVLFLDEFIITLPDWFLWLLPTVGVVLRGLCLIPEYKTVYKYNVKL